MSVIGNVFMTLKKSIFEFSKILILYFCRQMDWKLKLFGPKGMVLSHHTEGV